MIVIRWVTHKYWITVINDLAVFAKSFCNYIFEIDKVEKIFADIKDKFGILGILINRS